VNRPLRKVAVAAALLLLALPINVNVLQVGEAGSLNANPNNHLPLYQEYSRPRGPIVVGGVNIAKSVPTNDSLKYLRTYPDGSLYADVTGYYSLIYGSSGVERAENSVLAGTDDRLLPERLSDYFTGRTPQGGSVVLTLNPAAQQAAAQGLSGHQGAVVALDPTTGALLALYSSPSYDPSGLSSHNSKAITADWKSLANDPNQPMLDRAISQTYPPGSTFKVITAAAALSSGQYTPNSTIPAPSQLTFPNTTHTLSNFAGEECPGNGSLTLTVALQVSCNTAFGDLGEKIGSAAIARQAQAFGFGQSVDIPMTSAPSRYDQTDVPSLLADSAIGQYDDSVTPLQMAMVAAGIANGGVVMKPYLISEVRSPDESVLDRATPAQLNQAVSPSVAEQLTAMMKTVVQPPGTGTAAAIPGIPVAAKTGTAENVPGQATHAWFISFAPADHPRVAVAVIVEHGGVGGAVAAPIAKQVMCAVLGCG
jgi:peptidoglycan glycosyltransferase